MTIIDMPNFLWITIGAMVVLTLFCNLALNKWFAPAIITFIILGIAAFLIPNFQDITYEPLLGYAAFLAIISLIISFLIWYFTRNFRRKRKEKKMQKAIAKRGGIPEEHMEDYKHNRKR
ncbi:hypothetical protein BUZ14_12485 [Staphylococcus gallinarum]|uniref:Permease n=1 Tax=Staphylococcus gallinarum TaxID=1293 RepID=A0A3A0VJ57_STAGA|nr:hypothetical protein [Staphylococcus gallinarum]RIP32745.1 hypothetical protein BUZ14_12485 [Staphylococcus gallinarum]